MAIIYSYPKITSPLATDVLVLTDTTVTAGKRKNKTKSIAMSDVANYVIDTKSGITGTGTINTFPIFTASTIIGDSIITQAALGQGITVGGSFIVTNDTNLQGSLLADSLEVTNDSVFTGSARFNGTIKDTSGGVGTNGQVLTSTGTGVAWTTDAGGSVTQISYNGKISDLGQGNYSPFNGDTVEWGGVENPSSQTSAIIYPYEVKIESFYFKSSQVLTDMSTDFEYAFNFYNSSNLSADPNQGQSFIFPTGAQPFAGFANSVTSMYPLQFDNGGKIIFRATTPIDTDVRFVFEANPFPNNVPNFSVTATLLASNGNMHEYSVAIPPFGPPGQTFNSAIFYVVQNDVEVSVGQIKIETFDALGATIKTNYPIYDLTFGGSIYNGGTWSVLGPLDKHLNFSDNNTAPGFIEDVSDKNYIVPANTMLAMAGVPLSGSIASSVSEATVGLIVSKT